VIEGVKDVETRCLRSHGLGEQFVSTARTKLVTEPERLAAHALRLPVLEQPYLCCGQRIGGPEVLLPG
jgi:hypothetical protein